MEQPQKIDLFDSRLVFSQSKILFEGRLIHDFEDRYRNVSSIGVEQQNQIFQRIIKSIGDTGLSNPVKALNLILFAYLFNVMSARNGPSSILIIGGNMFKNTYAELLGLFGNDNKVYEICSYDQYSRPSQSGKITSIVANDLHELNFLSDRTFSLIFVNIDPLDNRVDSVIDQCNRLVRKNGKVVFYGSGSYHLEISPGIGNLYRLGSEGFIVSVDDSGGNHCSREEDLKENALGLIQSYNSELVGRLQYIMSNRPTSRNDLWHRKIDESVSIMTKIESIIAKHYLLFENPDLKFQTNEVKNALLDFKYETYLHRKHYDFFQSSLFDCYNNWTDQLY